MSSDLKACDRLALPVLGEYSVFEPMILAQTMNPSDVLSIVYVSYVPWLFMGNQSRPSQIDVLNAIDPTMRSSSDIHKTLHLDKTTPKKIEDALKRDDVQARVAGLFNISPDIFKQPDVDSVHSFMGRYVGQLGIVQYTGLQELTPGARKDDDFCRNEYRLLSRIADVLSSPRQIGKGGKKRTIDVMRDKLTRANLIHWPSSILSGASYLASKLHQFLPPDGNYARIFVVQPAAKGEPFNAELMELASRLGLNHNDAHDPVKLSRALIDQRALLILLFPFMIPERQPSNKKVFALNLIRHLSKRGPLSKDITPVMIIGDTPISLDRRDIVDISSLADAVGSTPLEVAPKKRFEVFRAQFARFSAFRGQSTPETTGTRLKRARWHYESVRRRSIVPNNIRMRAFFASNKATLSYFDPTAGFDRLAGMPRDNLPEDIALLLAEVSSYLETLTSPKAKKTDRKLRFLRFCSTSLYWLSSRAMEILSKGDVDLGIGKLQSVDRLVCEELADVAEIVEVPWGIDREELGTQNRSDIDERYYVTSIIIKSIVQDQWRIDAPVERALSHYLVAERLFKNQNEKDLLRREFPLQPNWGRYRIHFLSECIRHLMRSCDAVEQYEDAKMQSSSRQEFPDRPTKSLKGCDPYQVLAFCFGRVFNRELNGNDESHQRKLSRQHGAYRLNAELLQLMSNNEKLGEPHWALHPDLHDQYYREVAYTLLDLGRLKEAEASFKRLLSHQKSEKNDFGVTHATLDLVLVNVLAGQTDTASDLLASAKRQNEDRRQASTVKSGNSKQEAIIDARIFTREAHLFYVLEDYENAMAAFEEMISVKSLRLPVPQRRKGAGTKSWGSIFSRETAQCYIATLAQAGTPEHLDKAMSLCLENLFFNTSEGANHEALNFRVTLARLLRHAEKLDAAEKCLDCAYMDILQFGCSERTLIGFMFEAGLVLTHTSHQPNEIATSFRPRYARAYALYLRPCLERVVLGGYRRKAESTMHIISQCLAKLEFYAPMFKSEHDWSQSLRQELMPHPEFNNSVTPSEEGLLASDPHHSYDIIDGRPFVERLKTTDAIRKELMDCRRLQESM